MWSLRVECAAMHLHSKWAAKGRLETPPSSPRPAVTPHAEQRLSDPPPPPPVRAPGDQNH